ncbi:DUF7550 family protein [Halovivax cerinus]|uniref:Uncharacterized protein n=1 Tax=Halovivax cerinus TaxID=1487865 RepID=A0ABD5NT04_9EURY|nr:hypothetical protein [Halovivax cerinus]
MADETEREDADDAKRENSDDAGSTSDDAQHTPRETAPMSDFEAKNAAIGAAILVVGLGVSIGVPLFVL